jgi:hypothetical protein
MFAAPTDRKLIGVVTDPLGDLWLCARPALAQRPLPPEHQVFIRAERGIGNEAHGYDDIDKLHRFSSGAAATRENPVKLGATSPLAPVQPYRRQTDASVGAATLPFAGLEAAQIWPSAAARLTE